MNIDTGIYKIASPSGNFYIGSATSFRKRWDRHLYLLRKGLHHSKALQSAYEKYDGRLEFSVVARCPITDLLAVEQRYIDALKPRYNVSKVAGSNLGNKFSPEARARHAASLPRGERHHLFGKTQSAEMRARISASLKGEKHPNFGKPLTQEAQERLLAGIRKAVICVETGVVYQSGIDAARWLRLNGHPTARNSHISSTCNGRLDRAYGYKWQFEKVS